MKTLSTLALLIALSAISTAFAQAGASNSISGTWKVAGDVAGNSIDQVCTFAQDGKKLSGSCKPADDKAVEITGEVSDKKVSWQYNTDYNGEKLTIVYTGGLDTSGSQLKGDIDVQPMAVTGTFSAEKQGAQKEEPK